MYYLQHERPCCIGRYKLEPKARVCMSDTTRTRIINRTKYKLLYTGLSINY